METRITIPVLLLSILNLVEPDKVERKLNTIEAQLVLNEVEKKIIEDIRNGIQVDSTPSLDFIEERYSYYFTDIILETDMYSADAIDSAIANTRVEQLRKDMASSLIDLGGKVASMPPRELKDHIGELYSNALIESKTTTPLNGLQKRKSAYDEYTEHLDGLLLVDEQIEKHSGKALKGTVVSILAAPGEYKSTYSMNVAYQNAMADENVLYLMLESTDLKLEQKLVVLHIAKTAKARSELIKSNWVREKKLTKEQSKYFDKKQNEMIDILKNRLIVWDTSDVSIDTQLDMTDILRKADKLFQDTTDKGLDAVIIDQISLLKYTKGSGKKHSYDGAAINEWVNYLRDQALNFLDTGKQIVVFQVSQVRREAFIEVSKPKKLGRYDTMCSSDSHEIERTSATMITLFKDKEFINNVLVNVPKAREGEIPMHPLQLEVHAEYGLFGPIPCDEFGDTYTADDFDAGELSLDDFMEIEE